MFQLIGYVWEALCGDGVIWSEATLEEQGVVRESGFNMTDRLDAGANWIYRCEGACCAES